MGSLQEYHVLLCINKTQEVAIKQLFLKKGWTLSCQELNEEIVCNIREKLSEENNRPKQEFGIATLSTGSAIPLCDPTEQIGARVDKVTRQSKRKSVLPTRNVSVKTRLKTDSVRKTVSHTDEKTDNLRKTGSDADESNDPLEDESGVSQESSLLTIHNITQSDGGTRDLGNLHQILDLEDVSEQCQEKDDSCSDVKDKPETSHHENTDTTAEIQDRSCENQTESSPVGKGNVKQKKKWQHKRKRKHVGRLKNKSRLSKQSNPETKCKVKKSNSVKDSENFTEDSRNKKPRLEDGKVPDEELPISCYYCDRRFAYEKYLKKHLARIHPQYSPGMFCEYCGANFKRRPDLYAHIKEAHPDRKIKNIQCDLCGNVFRSKGAYVEHLNAVHTEERAYKCDICHKSYKSYRVLKIHKLRHGPAQEICGICGKMFRLRSEVKHHMRRHQNDRRIQCETCNKVFYRNSELKNHQRIHTGEKPYKCEICPYACTIKGNLDKHMKTHDKVYNGKTWNRRKKVLLNGAVLTLTVETANAEWTSNVQSHIDQNIAGSWPTPSINEEKNAVTALQQCENLPNPDVIIDNAEHIELSQRLVIDEFRIVSERNSNNYHQVKNTDTENPISHNLFNENMCEGKYQSNKSSQNNAQMESNEKRPKMETTKIEKIIPTILQSNSSRPAGQCTQKLPSPGKTMQWNAQTPYVGNVAMTQPTLAVLQPVVYTQMKPSNEMQWCPPRTDIVSSQALNQETTQNFQTNFY